MRIFTIARWKAVVGLHPMPHKSLLFTLVIALSVTSVHCQRQVRGEVFAKENNESLPFATVMLIAESDSSLWGGTSTDGKGSFALPLPDNQTVYLLVRMMGYKPSQRIIISDGNSDVQIPRISLEEDATLLNDVVVLAQKPLFEILPDRLVVNVDASISFSGRSALYVLQQTPGLIVNPNGTISANGKNGVSIMLNGRIVKLSSEMIGPFLEGLAASTIEKIEFVRNPEATLDADGEAGIIHVVTKDRNSQGFRGSIFSSAGYSWKPKAGFGGNATFSSEKVHLSAQYSFNRNYTTTYWDNFFDYSTPTGNMSVASYNLRHENNTNQSLTFQTDYRVTPRSTIGVNFIMNVRDHGYAEGKPSSVTTTVKRNDNVESFSRSSYAERNRWDQYAGNLNVRHQLNQKASVSADVDYLYSFNHIPVNYAFRFFSDNTESLPSNESTVRTLKKTPITTYALKLDYNYAIKPGLSFAGGIKYTSNTFYNTFSMDSLWNGEWIRDQESSSRYRYNEKIPAGYLSTKITLSPKDELSAGIRYESTHMEIVVDDSKTRRLFTNLFPHFSLTRNIDPGKTSLNATLSRRINRPSYWDLAPFAIFLGPNVFVAGNESLRPSLSNSATITYSGTAINYSLTGNLNQYTIANYQISLTKADNMIRANAQNLTWSKSAHFSISIPVTQLMRIWETSNTIAFFGEKILSSGAQGQQEHDLIGFRYTSNNTFILPRSWKFELNGNYSSTTLAGTSRHLAFGTITAGIGKQTKHYVINLNASDVLWSWRWNRTTIGDGFRSEMRYLGEPRVVTLTLRRNIGNERVNNLKKRSTAAEDELLRL